MSFKIVTSVKVYTLLIFITNKNKYLFKILMTIILYNLMLVKYLIKGSSSLLFIISTIKAFYCSKLIMWKISNFFLIFASFLCNATDYLHVFLLMDYISIFLVCLSYINNFYINLIYFLILAYEYYKYNSIENTKNIAFVNSIIKSIINTYYNVDKFHFYIIITSTIFGIIIYKIRYYFHINNNYKYTLLMTYLFHICTMNIMYITSITAN